MAGLHKNGAKLSKGVPFVLRQERLSVFAQDYEESPLELFMRYLGVVPRQEIEIYERGAPKHKKGECKTKGGGRGDNSAQSLCKTNFESCKLAL